MSPRPSRSPRHRRLLFAFGVLPALSSLAACSGGDDSAKDTTPAPATAVTAGPTSTGDAATTTGAASSTDTPSTTAAATTTPITEAPAAPVQPLTGVPVTDPAIAARAALVVKIDNAPGARPQTGMNEADIAVEEIVNDGYTRFALVFHSGGSDPVGPIRSGRIQDIDLFGSFNRPLFAWSGGNATVTAAIRASDLVEIGPTRAPVYFRSNTRRAPHNLYSTTTALWSRTPFGAPPPPQQFAYRSADEAAAGVPSGGVQLTLDTIDVRWNWDPATALYRRTMEGRPHEDTVSGQVTTNNVVVLAVDYLPGISGSPDAQTIGSGEVFVFTAGNYVHGTWTRADRLAPFTLTADDGTTIELTPGRTFIELPRYGTTTPMGAPG